MKPYYEDGNGITIYHGDCREVLPTLPKFDLLLTDPPYGIGISANPVRQKHPKSDWDNKRPDDAVIDIATKAAEYAIIWGGNYFGLKPSRKFLVWDKKQPEDFSLAMVELAWCSWDGNAKLFASKVNGSYTKCHPTQKPEDLMRWCMKQVPKPFETILDPFMGSGTTLVAAKREGRKAVGIELEERYCEAAVKRLQQGVFDFDS